LVSAPRQKQQSPDRQNDAFSHVILLVVFEVMRKNITPVPLWNVIANSRRPCGPDLPFDDLRSSSAEARGERLQSRGNRLAFALFSGIKLLNKRAI